MLKNPLNKIVNIRTIQKLYQDGILDYDTFVEAKKVLHPTASWYAWANRTLLLFGSALVLAGIIYFFAYNWSKLGKFLKFGFIECGIVACITIAYYLGITKLSGKVLVLSASVLVGVLLAVYGQTYQTGADAFELFRGWALLIVGWVIISEFSALWILWLVILNISVILFWKQVGQLNLAIQYEWLCLTIAILNSLAMAFREIGLRLGFEWLKSGWLRAMLLIVVLAFLSVPIIHLIVDIDGANRVTVLVSCIWVFAAMGGYIFYRYKIPDMIPIAIIVMDVCIVLLTGIGKILFHNSHEDAGIFLLFALIILAVASGAVFWLKKTKSAITAEIKEVQ